ncbi:MAG: FtsX-like permease family protein, partial [Oscillospiraceae bacterium]|nr:FtsX-like permease family protein [Oscillospiraceae bacterium]
MWKIYTLSAIRRNKTMGIAAIIAILIASTFLSMMCGFAYNTWADAVRRAAGAPVDAGPVAPLLLMALVVGLSIVWILSSAFSVSMQARVRHMGILASVGATPRQQRAALVQEVLALSLPAILAGIVLGIGLTWGIVQYSNAVAKPVQTDRIRFEYHGLIFLLTLIFCTFSVWLSAMWCARKLARLTPLEAIRGGGEWKVKKMREFRIFGLLFGAEGTLARKSLYARRKVFRTSVLSLTLSVLVFSTFLNVMTLSDISTEQTYFERYKNTWDLR